MSTWTLSSAPSKLRVFLLVGYFALWFGVSTNGVVAEESDDHGDTIDSATSLALGSSVDGRIDPEDDQDVFQLDLSSQSSDTDVWIYATGDLNSFGELLSGTGAVIVSNDNSFFRGRWHAFNIRWNLSSDVYYVRVSGSPSESTDRRPTGEYTLHVQAVTAYPGGTTEMATLLDLDSVTPGMIEEKSDEDFFRVDVAESMNLVIEGWTSDLYDGKGEELPQEDLDVEVLDSRGAVTLVNVRVFFFGFEIADEFEEGTYYIRVSTPDYVESHPVPYAIHAFEDTGYTDFLEDCEAESRSLDDTQSTDPLYGCQWHLNNREGEDINIEAVWTEGIMGSGINVAVVDDGMDYLHEDLKANVDRDRNHDYTDKGDIYHPYWHHGTNVAGIISAPDYNGVGVRGVAPRTTVYGYNYLVDPTDSNEADAMARERDVTAVSNNSWGPLDGPSFDFATRFWEMAVDAGIGGGYGGKGVFYSFAAGNGHLKGDESNLDEYANYYGVTAVCAVDDEDIKSSYSETGANLWICAPSSGGRRGIVTTENSNRYYTRFGGTSAATPIVSGVAALMREANPDLTWRDLKLILAASARKNDPDHPGWERGAYKYGTEVNTDRYHFSHEYGFGMVDAKAAVDLARSWVNLPSFEISAEESDELNLRVPDAPADGEFTTIESALTMSTGIGFVEFVEINATIDHDSFRDLEIELVSPLGTVSQLVGHFDTLNDHPDIDFVQLNSRARFGSARHLGEDPNGEWKLRITDHIHSMSGELTSWSIVVYGHESTPSPPVADWITVGDDSLTVGWLSPRQTGGSPISAFDLRYSLASQDEAVNSTWTIVKDVWTASAGGKLEYKIGGLVGDARYDVQIRAVSEVGEGRWSEELTATVSPNTCDTDGAVSDAPNNPGLVSDCGTLLEAQKTFDENKTLNWGVSIPIADWQGITVGGTPNRVVGLSMRNQGLAGKIPRQVGNLTRLEEIKLAGNALTGEIPTQVGRLVNLVELDLASNELTGVIPAELASLVELRVLDLSQNLLTGEVSDELRWLANLTDLSLRENELSGEVPDWLGSRANLNSLFLAGNSFTGCIAEELGALPAHDLDQLGIPFCGRGVLVAFYNTTGGANWEVDTGWLSDKPIDDWYGVTVDSRGRVTEVRLPSNGLTGEIPTELGSLSTLRELNLRENDLTGEIPAQLGNLSKLKILYLNSNQLTGEIPTELGNLSELQSLYLSFNQLKGEIRTELTNLPKLQTLSLRSNLLTGEIPAELGNLSKLDTLYLSSNQLTGDIPPELGNLSALQSLNLSYNQLSGEIAAELGKLSRLESLVLYGNQLTGPIPAELGNLSKLKTLGLSSNRLTGEIPTELGNLSNLQSLYLSQNRLTGCIPEALRRVPTNDLERLRLPFCVASAPGTPTISSGTSGVESLTITWSPPSNDGHSVITAYDLRYVDTASDETIDANWTVVEDVWITGSGTLVYTLYGLTGDMQYDLQIRAVNAVGEGPWSETESGTPKTQSDCVTGGAVADAANTGLISDCEALLAGRDTLARVVSLNWSTDTTISEWDGVTLRGAPARVAWLNIRGRGLGGSLPAQLGHLSNLTYLNLRNNGLSGPIPTELGNLTKLRYLGLNNNELTGSVPDLSRLTNLEELYLSNNDLSGGLPDWMGRLTKVKELWLWGNELSGTIPDLSGMAGLDRLKLQNNRFTGGIPAWFGEMTSLRYLYLHFNPLGGTIPSELGGMERLRYLWIHNGQLIGGIPPELVRLTNLWDLNLHTNQLSDPIPAELGGMDSLQRLRLHRNMLSGEIPPELGNLARLRFIWLHGNMLEGSIPAELGDLRRLERLWLSENKLTGQIPKELGELSSHKLAQWRLSGGDNQFTGCLPAGLATMEDTDFDSLGLPVCTDS